jgi:carboxylesterase
MTNHLLEPYSSDACPDLTGGRSVGVLVCHGFTGSPASMRPWAEHLADKGYAVELPRLPGHGSRWQDLNATTWEDWSSTVTTSFEKLRANHDAVAVVGLSMGGMLALRLAADRADEVACLVVVNPMVVTKRKDVLALPLLKWVVPSFPGIINDIKKPDADELGYPRVPLKAAHSMFRAGRALVADLDRVTAPLLIFKSEEDHVVDEASVPLVVSRVSSTEVVERRLADSYHVATLDHDAPAIFEESAAFIARVTG